VAAARAASIILIRAFPDRFAVFANSTCRVGELVKLKVSDVQASGEHRLLRIYGKGGKERTTLLQLEAVERLAAWIAIDGNREDRSRPLFRPARSPQGSGVDGFTDRPMTTHTVEYFVARYVRELGLDPAVTVHSLRVTALTTARERGSDILDLQDFAGHSDPRTTLSYIRSRDRLSKSPTYILHY
jgi:integrase/recombinase XerD